MTPDLGFAFLYLAFAAFGAGAIRGFSGFGDALFFLPIGSIVLTPIEAMMCFFMVAVLGPLPLLPKGIQDAPRAFLIPLNLGMLLLIPAGFYLLTLISPEISRYILSFMAITVVALMALGLKPNFHITSRFAGGLGAFCGFIGGFTGLPGSLMMYTLLNSQLSAKDIRALGIVTLLVFDFSMLIAGGLYNSLTASLAITAMFLLPIYILGTWLGRQVFDPQKEKLFRAIAFFLILTSGILGLPLFGEIGH